MRHSITIFTIGLTLFGASFNLFAKAEEIGIAAISVETNVVGKGEFTVNDIIYVGDEITTGSKGTTTILFNDESMLTLGPNAHAHIETYQEGSSTQPGSSIIRVSKGQFRYFPGDILENGGSQLIAVADKLYGKTVNSRNNAPIISPNTVIAERVATIDLSQAKYANKRNKAQPRKKNASYKDAAETGNKQGININSFTIDSFDANSNSALNRDATEKSSAADGQNSGAEQVEQAANVQGIISTQPDGVFVAATPAAAVESGSNTAVPMCPTCPNGSGNIKSDKDQPDPLSSSTGLNKLPNDFSPENPLADNADASDIIDADGNLVRPGSVVKDDNSVQKQSSYSRYGMSGKVVFDTESRTTTVVKISTSSAKTESDSLLDSTLKQGPSLNAKNVEGVKLERISALRILPPAPRQLTATIPTFIPPTVVPTTPPIVPPTPGGPSLGPPGIP